MRAVSVVGALLMASLGAGVVGCTPTPPRLWVSSVQFTPKGAAEATYATTSQEPFILPSGISGTIDVFFAANVDGLNECTLMLEGVHGFTPTTLDAFGFERRMQVRISTAGLANDRLTKGSIDCSGTDAWGTQKAGDEFSVATRMVIVSFVNTGQLDFPTTQAGSQSRSEVVLLGNFGSLRADVLAVRISGRDGTDFRFLDEPCAGITLGREESCEVTVVFDPQSAGDKSAILQFELTSADPEYPDSVTEIVLLRGTATPAPPPTTPPPEEQPPHPPTG